MEVKTNPTVPERSNGMAPQASSKKAHWVSLELPTRVFATLLMTIMMINIVLNVMGELQEELMRQAFIDPLTGAFNRRQMELYA